MSTNAYEVGQQVRLDLVITSTGTTAPESGTNVSLVITAPSGGDTTIADGSLSTFAPTTASTGYTGSTDSATFGVAGWYYDTLTTEGGTYRYQWRSTGTVLGSKGGRFAVKPRTASTST